MAQPKRTERPVVSSTNPVAKPGRRLWTFLISGVVLVGPALVYLVFFRPGSDAPAVKSPVAEEPEIKAPKTSTPEAKKTPEPSSFLEDFTKGAFTEEAKDGALSNAELEQRWAAVEKIKEEQRALFDRIMADKKEDRAAEQELERVRVRLDNALEGLEKELGRAKKVRPADPVVRWLTAELLILIGTEPEFIFPHLHNALEGGLDRARLWASLARTETEDNRLVKAYQSAVKALDKDDQDPYVWKTFGQTAFHVERFGDVLERLARAFPDKRPAWADDLKRKAGEYAVLWQAEQKLREAEKRADDLPRVRVVVDHRRFERGPKGDATGKIVSSGSGEFVVELFENQAPATVANFVSLVGQKTYDGTRFYLAESAALIAGGDPNSRTGDPRDDGLGGPGYVIPDEFKLPGARRHFRGSLSMVNGGPRTAGSQFFITLVPKQEMDGHFTVFGRVIKGMEVVDNITRGRTNNQVGRYGLIVPGDVVVRAEVLRKRPHEYKVIKEKAKAAVAP